MTTHRALQVSVIPDLGTAGMLCFEYFNEKFLGFGGNGTTFGTARNGVSWNFRELGVISVVSPYTSPFGVSSAAVGNGVCIANPVINQGVIRTTDGDNWTEVALSSGQSTGCAFGNNVFILARANGGAFRRSTDNGLSWSDVPGPATGTDVVFSGVNFIAVSGFSNHDGTGSNPPLTAHYSPTGQTWTSVALPPDPVGNGVLRTVYKILVKDGVVLALGTDNEGLGSSYWRSTDHGASWTRLESPRPGDWQSSGVAGGSDGYFVIVGNTYIAATDTVEYNSFYSAEGLAWRRTEFPITTFAFAYVAKATAGDSMFVRAFVGYSWDDPGLTSVAFKLSAGFWTNEVECIET